MKTGNLVKVQAMLSAGPLSIEELSTRTGLSYSSVRRALAASDVVAVEGTWPKEWRLRALAPIETKTPELDLSGYHTVPKIDTEVSVAKWNASNDSLVEGFRGLVVTPEGDPEALSIKMKRLAGLLLTMAENLHQVEQYPDWYEKLGGVDENSPFG